MKKIKFHIVLLTVCAMTTSCMSTKLVAKYNSDNIIHHKATEITYLWGAIVKKDIQAKCEPNALICQVTTETNFGFICISFLTLGIVVPQKIEWDCCICGIKEEEFK